MKIARIVGADAGRAPDAKADVLRSMKTCPGYEERVTTKSALAGGAA